MADFVGAIDQGTTSSRFMVFDRAGDMRAAAQIPHDQVLPRPGWVEHDPVQILDRTREAIGRALSQLGLCPADLAAVGITNQRETTVAWNRRTGLPYANAVVWQDTRTAALAAELEREHGATIRERTGLPPSTYFSGPKLRWLLDEVDGLRADARAGEALFGTMDSWLIWNLTGGPDGGAHVTDVTNASRTMLMDLRSLDWDDELLRLCDVPREMLPSIRSSSASDGYGALRDPALAGARLTAVLGDQHAATVGQACFAAGEAKNTYGTGNFLMLNTGERLIASNRGLISTVLYRWEGADPVYALEGSVAVTGAAVQWLRDQLGLIAEAAQIEELAARVPDAAGAYFVPAFSGLFAPYWRPDARGAIVGLSRFHTAGHLARATLEAICYQTRDVAEAMRLDVMEAHPGDGDGDGDAHGALRGPLKVDGGVSANELCMQLQADILGVPVIRPQTAETTAWGAASAAGLAVGFWPDQAALRRIWRASRTWEPQWDESRREAGYRGWAKAVSRTLDWAEPDERRSALDERQDEQDRSEEERTR